jgi:hypothetical protein
MGVQPTAAVSAGEVLAALSLATDLGTDQPLEHGLRTAVLCSRLAAAAGGDDELQADAYHLGLLHSIGCTSDAHEAAAAYGDDRPVRSDFATIDSGRPNEVMAFLWRRTAESRAPHVGACRLRRRRHADGRPARGAPGRRGDPLRARRAARAGAPVGPSAVPRWADRIPEGQDRPPGGRVSLAEP